MIIYPNFARELTKCFSLSGTGVHASLNFQREASESLCGDLSYPG